MKKLKIIFQSKYLYIVVLLFSLCRTIICIQCPPNSYYSEKNNAIKGYVEDYKIYDNKIVIILKSKEKILVNYNKKINILYGDYIYVYGKFYRPNSNDNFNLFNYRKYLLSKKINYIVDSTKIKLIKHSNNVFYKLKNTIRNRIYRCSKTKNYIMMFLLGDKNYVDKTSINNYRFLGISHLLALSGMHVSLVVFALLKILSKLKKKYYIIISFLLIYLFLSGFSISLSRACYQFILFHINDKLKLNIKNINIIILLFSLFLIYNPYFIYSIGFIFSFSISFSLLNYSNLLDNKRVIYKLLVVSLLSFFISLPVIINNFNQINILSIIYNVLFVSFISYIIFPFCILTFIFPFLDGINCFFINILESLNNIFSNITLLSFNAAKIPLILIIVYYIFLLYLFKRKNKQNVIKVLIMLMIFIFNKSYIFNTTIIFLSIGQGDSSLIRIHNKNIVIDVGGSMNNNISNHILIPFFKNQGIKKINYLLLSHGDFDHMGEAINLVNNFKVEKVIFNCGPYNNLEKDLIKVLDKKKIKYYSCIKELNIDKNKLYFLQTKEYDNENDNSNVIYTELDGYKFMFMGDASVTTEKEILDKYDLPNIDVLKVGHHGSRTSSSKDFIDEINPRYSVISVGKNNRYGHPNKEVLNNLENSKIYRTDQDGSIMFKIKNNKLKIETCSP